MVLSGVVTTSASSAAMKEATEVRASTAAVADRAFESVMNPFLIGCKDGRQRSTHRRRPLPLGRMRMGKGFGGRIFSLARILWLPSDVFSKAGGRRHRETCSGAAAD